MKKFEHLIRYGIGGVLTTGVNYIIYFLLCYLGTGYLAANTAAWAGAVLFSYWVNRKVVFHSVGIWYKELLSFCSLRLVTLAVENLLLFGAIDCLHMNGFIAKIAVSFITVLSNYVICQKKIFTKGVS